MRLRLCRDWGLAIGDWRLGIGDWGLAIGFFNGLDGWLATDGE